MKIYYEMSKVWLGSEAKVQIWFDVLDGPHDSINNHKIFCLDDMLYDKKQDSSSILIEVRMRVNDNIQKIKNTIETKLYNYLGLNPADLDNIIELTNGNQKSLRFEYNSGKGLIKKRSWAFADEWGNVKDVVHFK